MYYYNYNPLKSAVEELLKEKVEACLDQAAGETIQTPKEFWDSLVGNCHWPTGVSVKRDENQISVRFDGRPEEDRIEASNIKYTHKDETYVILQVYWGEYLYHSSSEYRPFKFKPTFDGFMQLIEEFPEIVVSMEKRMPAIQKKQKERDDNHAKREKAREIRINAIRSWLNELCKQLEVPYHVEEMKSRFDLYLLMPDETQAQFQMPINHFEDSVSEIPALIEQLLALYRHKKTKLIVQNYSPFGRINWKQNN